MQGSSSPEAISLAATLLAYHGATATMEPNPEWVAKLDGASDKFRELGRKAAATAGSVGRAPAGVTTEDPSGTGPALEGDAATA